jgi:hypothetical protein
MASVLGVGWLGARISRARWGKMWWAKWPIGGSGSLIPAVSESEGGRGVDEALS